MIFVVSILHFRKDARISRFFKSFEPAQVNGFSLSVYGSSPEIMLITKTDSKMPARIVGT